MKYLVVSNIHSSNYYANKLKEIINKENPDKIILYSRRETGTNMEKCKKETWNIAQNQSFVIF